jgi:hypothetical protein
MRLVHRDAAEPSLKQVARPARARIDESGVAPMRFADRAGKAGRCARDVGAGWRQEQVHMVRHQTVSRADHAVKLQPFGEEVAVEREVRRLGENLHPAVAALGDVMGNVRKDDTSEPSHAGDAGVERLSYQWVSCPRKPRKPPVSHGSATF